VAAAPLPPKATLTPAIIGETLRSFRQIQELNAATKTKGALDYAQYSEKVADLATVVDDLLRAVEESGGFESNADLREICKRASDAFFDHNLALNHWNVERSLKADKEAVRRAHQAKIESSGDKPEVVQSVNETTDELDELTYRVMRAINDRYDLWIDAQQQEDALQPLVARLGK
jgi:acyl carrier protein phosphodiesterase